MFTSILLVLLLTFSLCSTQTIADDDAGFLRWFTTNNETFDNHPIEFDNVLPSWIHGTLVRNGPGIFESGSYFFVHAFDGYSKLNSWKFSGQNSVLFTSKMLQSEFYRSSIREEKITPYLTFGPINPPRNAIENFEAVVNQMDNMNVNIYNFSGASDTVAALNDVWKVYEVNISRLETIRSFKPKIPQQNNSMDIGTAHIMSTAHPVPECGKTTHLTFLSSSSFLPGVKSTITLARVKSLDDREIIAEWDVDDLPYMHSFSVTPNYVIMHAAPYFASVEDVLKAGDAEGAMKWDSKKNATIFVVNLSSGKVVAIQSSPSFILHHANAYEEDENTIVFDAPTYVDGKSFNIFDLKTLRNATKRTAEYSTPNLTRHVLDLKRNNIQVRSFQNNKINGIMTSKFDFPIINEQYRCMSYCFMYGLIFNGDGKDFKHTALVKKDMCGKNRDGVFYIPNHYPSEPWFVPSPSAVDEDDGYLMSVVLNGDKQQSYIALIDAKTMNITNTAYLPTAIPFPMHGRFFPSYP